MIRGRGTNRGQYRVATYPEDRSDEDKLTFNADIAPLPSEKTAATPTGSTLTTEAHGTPGGPAPPWRNQARASDSQLQKPLCRHSFENSTDSARRIDDDSSGTIRG